MNKPLTNLLRRILWVAAGIPALLGAAPTLTQHPTATVITTSGEAATLSAQATGTGTIRWQWRRAGLALSGQTNASLTLPAATMADVGYYDVVATDDTGSTTSAPSRLMVTPVGGYKNTFRLDTSFRPTFEKDGATIYGIAVAPDGRVYVTGDFVRIAGENHTGVARFSENLAVDSAFNPPVLSAGYALAVQPDGKVIVSANARRADGTTAGPLVRLLNNGSIDDTFTAPVFSPGNFPSAAPVLALQPDGKILVAGSFAVVANVPRTGIARLNADGTIDSSFVANLGASPSVTRVALSGGKIIVLGSFRTSTGANRQLIRLNSDGSEDTAFIPQVYSINGYGGFAVDAIGRIYVNGNVTSGSGVKTLRLLADGSVDASFNVSSSTRLEYLAPIADGRLVATWWSGSQPFCGILAEDGSIQTSRAIVAGTASSLPDRFAITADAKIYVAGSCTYAPFAGGAARLAADCTTVATVPSGLLSRTVPTAVRPARDGKWIVGGSFTYANGIPSQGLARLNADGSTDTTFTADNPSLSVNDVAIQGDGAVLAMGNYQPFARRFLANGQRDPAFSLVANASLTSATRFLVLPDGRFAVLGWISSYAGEYVNTGLLLLQPNGVRDPSLASVIRPTSSQTNTLIEAVGGGFVAAGSLPLNAGIVDYRSLLRFDGAGNVILPQTINPPAGVAFDATGRLVAIDRNGGQVFRLDQQGTIVATTPVPTLAPKFLLAGVIPQTDDKVLVEASARPSLDQAGYGPLLRLNADNSIDTTFRIPDLRGTFGLFPYTTAQYTDNGRLLVCGAQALRGSDEQVGLALFKSETLPPAPVITRQPLSTNAPVGGLACFEVEATGDISFYRWYKGDSVIATTTDPRIYLPNLTTESYNVYTAEVVGPGGIARSKPVMLGISGVAGQRYRLLDYFSPLVVGNEWRYTRNDSAPERTQARSTVAALDRTITTYEGGAATTPAATKTIAIRTDLGATPAQSFVAAEGWTDYFGSDGSTIGFHGNDVPGPQTNRFAGAFRFPATMAVGESSVSTADAYVNGTWTSATSFAFRLVGVESVITPAGTFNDCLHIRFSTADDGPWQYEDQWWAPGVGTVKTYRTRTGVTQLLESSTVQQPVLPSIPSGPGSPTIPANSPTALSIVATGTGPLSYQWYQGESGDTAQPLAGATTATFTTPALSVRTKFWVRVANRSGTTDSPTATVSIAGAGIPFTDWIAASDAPAGQRGELDTPAHDGVPNLMKYALGVAPMAAAGAHLPVAAIIDETGQPAALAILFARNPSAHGIGYVLEVSTDLAAWRETTSTTDLLGINSDGTERVRMREAAPTADSPRFVRLKVVPTGP